MDGPSIGLELAISSWDIFALEQTCSPEEFQDFVEECHPNNIGVIVDWVPGHFIIDDDALAYYDGTQPLNTRMNITRITTDGALNFDLGRTVQSFFDF